MTMRRFAFISRHQPTPGQVEIAARGGIELVPVGDRDGFTIEPSEFLDFAGVVVVHAGAALALAGIETPVGVFENAARPAEGGKPSFEAVALQVWTPFVSGESVQMDREIIR